MDDDDDDDNKEIHAQFHIHCYEIILNLPPHHLLPSFNSFQCLSGYVCLPPICASSQAVIIIVVLVGKLTNPRHDI